jgi:hypothetical protein
MRLGVLLSSWLLLIKSAFVYGLGLSAVLTAIMAISAGIAQDMFVGDYPPDIRKKYGSMSPRSARLRPLVGVIFFIPVLAIPLLGLLALWAKLTDVSFIPAFAFSAVALLVFNMYDLLVLDWLFFCTIQPRIMVLPGTEGVAGYRDYRFHFIGFVKGLGFCTVGSLLIAGLWLLAQGITG